MLCSSPSSIHWVLLVKFPSESYPSKEILLLDSLFADDTPGDMYPDCIRKTINAMRSVYDYLCGIFDIGTETIRFRLPKMGFMQKGSLDCDAVSTRLSTFSTFCRSVLQ